MAGSAPLEPVVVAGGSLAGLTAAEQLRRDGYGGAITVVEPEQGPAYDRPPLSKQVLTGAWEPDKATLHVAKQDLGLDWRRGERAAGLDVGRRTLRLSSGEDLAFGSLVVATGTSARWIPGTEAVEGIHVLRTMDDCLAVRRDLDADDGGRVLVVGAGFIGAEVASSCRERGRDVTMVEVADVPLSRSLGPEAGMIIAGMQRDHGVDLRLGTGVEEWVVDGGGKLAEAVLSGGERLACSLAVVGVGVSPNVAWLGGSGLALDNGVAADAWLRAAPGITAVGDVVRWPSTRVGADLRLEHWEHAVQSGEQAARTLLADAAGREAEPYDPVPWFWSDQHGHKIQLAGHSGPDDRFEVVHGSVEDRRFVALYGRAGRVIGVLGVSRPRHVMQLRQLVVDRAAWEDGVAAGHAL